MNLLETAYEILSEGRRSVAQMETTKRRYDVVKAHMYSIFECYAHGIIDWNTTKKYWKKSIVEYVKLYSYDKKAQLQEKVHMQKEYSNVLTRYKPALDEYRRVHESRLTTKLISKKQLTENQARKQSNTYYNRCLKESDLKDTKRLKWNSVLESYPNLTSKDRQRVRLLTIFEGPTVSTTQMITTVMGEAGPTSSPRPRLRPNSLSGNSNIGSTEMGPNGQMTGSTRGFDNPGFEFNPRAGHRDQPDHPENRGLTPSRLAPTTSPRPKMRPDNLGQRAAINRAVSQAMGEGYKELPPIDRDRYTEMPGLEGPFQTMSGKVVYYDPIEGAYYDRDTDMYLSYDEFKALDNDRRGMKESARGLGSIDWPDVDEDGDSAMAQHAENAIRHGMHAYDAYGHVYSMTRERDWMQDHKDELIKMFASYGLQTEGHSPHPKGSAKYKKHMAAMHAGMNEEMSDKDLDAFHRALDAVIHKHIGYGSHEKDDVDERKMTKAEKAKEKRLKKKYDDSDMKASMKKQYGDDWESVYFATIRKQAMEAEVNEARWEFKPNKTYMVGDRLTWDDKYEFYLSQEDADILNKFMQQADSDETRTTIWRMFWNSEETGDTAEGPVKAIAYAKKALGIGEGHAPDHNMKARMRLQKIMQEAIKDSKKNESSIKKIIKKNQQATKTETGERFAIINDNDDIEVYNSKTKRLIRKVRMSNRQSAIQRLKKATYKSSLDTFKGYQMWYSNQEPGLRFSEIDKELEEMTSAGAIASVAQPIGKMQRRKKTDEDKKKSPAGGPACWDGKKIHPTKPTKMKGGKRVNNCIDDGK